MERDIASLARDGPSEKEMAIDWQIGRATQPAAPAGDIMKDATVGDRSARRDRGLAHGRRCWSISGHPGAVPASS